MNVPELRDTASALVVGDRGLLAMDETGASFLRLDGRVWTTDKDGIVPALLAAEITARLGRDPGEIYRELARELGAPMYERIEAPATPEQRELLGKLSPQQVHSTDLAGEVVESIITHAPGNGAPIGGLKVIAKSGWFAARPSGTRAPTKIYAESFGGADHLRRILETHRVSSARPWRWAPRPDDAGSPCRNSWLGLRRGNDVLKILLAIDGSEHSHAAVDATAQQHYPAGSEVRVISVVQPPYMPDTFAGGGGSAGLYIQIEDTGRELARAAVDKAAATLRTDEGSRHLKVTTDVLSGSPKRVILDDAEAFGADWIVVGSHGLGTIERFLLGSVSQAVALHAKCSVAIVRRPPTPATKD